MVRTSSLLENTAYRTPNVQRLADEGCRFNNFYVPAGGLFGIAVGADERMLSGPHQGWSAHILRERAGWIRNTRRSDR